ncbi:uncharacterized protein METZ01_LOCUS345278, partial [marine metagenome]
SLGARSRGRSLEGLRGELCPAGGVLRSRSRRGGRLSGRLL